MDRTADPVLRCGESIGQPPIIFRVLSKNDGNAVSVLCHDLSCLLIPGRHHEIPNALNPLDPLH